MRQEYKYVVFGYESTKQRFLKEYGSRLDAKLSEYLTGKAKPENKISVRRIVEDSAVELLEMAMEPLEELFKEIDKQANDLRDFRELKAKMDNLGDERSKVAMSLYNNISKMEPDDDNFSKCRRITAAGLVAASYLGLRGYEVSNQKEEFKKY